MAFPIFDIISKKIPDLRIKLKKAGINDKPELFVKKTVMSALYLSAGITFSLFMMVSKYNALVKFLLICAPIMFIFLSFYMLKIPDAKIEKKKKEISKEIVFAGRHLVIELQSGVPVYNALINLSKNYKVLGKYFNEIIDKINFGTSLEDAINEAIELIPSDQFRRILWQILNSLRTGSDVVESLNTVIEQIVREQVIEVNKYGRKLNPLAMFYMIIAVILPSLGITMMIVLSSFIEFQLSLTILLFISFMLGFMQFMFMSIIKFSRPPIEF